jgi:hypothetical protein
VLVSEQETSTKSHSKENSEEIIFDQIDRLGRYLLFIIYLLFIFILYKHTTRFYTAEVFQRPFFLTIFQDHIQQKCHQIVSMIQYHTLPSKPSKFLL